MEMGGARTSNPMTGSPASTTSRTAGCRGKRRWAQSSANRSPNSLLSGKIQGSFTNFSRILLGRCHYNHISQWVALNLPVRSSREVLEAYRERLLRLARPNWERIRRRHTCSEGLSSGLASAVSSVEEKCDGQSWWREASGTRGNLAFPPRSMSSEHVDPPRILRPGCPSSSWGRGNRGPVQRPEERPRSRAIVPPR